LWPFSCDDGVDDDDVNGSVGDDLVVPISVMTIE
jgi:hypothetical protein